MTTDKQIAANRDNATLSTGPRTPEGKERSAANSTSHGLSSTAAAAVLPHENPGQFQQIHHNYVKEFQPTTEHETFLVEQMVHARWRIARIQRLETRLFSDAAATASAETGANPDSAILAHMSAKGVHLPTALQRYLNSAERSYYKAHRELTAARAQQTQTKAAEAGAQAAQARRAAAESSRATEKALMDYIYAPPPTLKSNMPLAAPGDQQPIPHATRQSLRAPAL